MEKPKILSKMEEPETFYTPRFRTFEAINDTYKIGVECAIKVLDPFIQREFIGIEIPFQLVSPAVRVGDFPSFIFDIDKAVCYSSEENRPLEKSKKYKKNLEEIHYRDIILRLAIPVELEIEILEEGWACFYRDLNLLSITPNLDESLEDIQEQFYLLYEAYTEKEDNELTKDAQSLKVKLLNLVI